MPIYTIRHRTIYVYSEECGLSVNQARLRPRELPGQRLMAFSLESTPRLEDFQEGPDFFGNPTAIFKVAKGHERFEICTESRVDVSWAERDAPPETSAWEETAEALRTPATPEAQDAIQFVLDSPLVKVFPELREYASASFPAGRPLGEAAFHLMRRIHRDFRFIPGSTSLQTTLEMVFQTRCGVCQDFSHLMLGCLRSLGLAGRYVSGYIETQPKPGKPRLVGADATHAWVSVFAPGTGWLDFDPTNLMLPGPQHITLAWGRDFSDVSPLRGVLYGGGTQKLKVEVDVLREDGSPSLVEPLIRAKS
ncbi:MAG: transglutaminase [Fibrobacteres bacterium]|nr:transglutaminase [Fibrobacterota bacterium]